MAISCDRPTTDCLCCPQLARVWAAKDFDPLLAPDVVSASDEKDFAMIAGEQGHPGSQFANFLEVLEWRADLHADRFAFTFITQDDEHISLTYSQLLRRVRAVAAVLQDSLKPSDRVLLVFPAGLDFIVGFLGCVAAGVLPVPATYPKPRRPVSRLEAIANDCRPGAVLTTAQTLTMLDLSKAAPYLRELPWLAVDQMSCENGKDWKRPRLTRDDLLFLQYTSGSTSDPRGVMVTHGNLLYNLEMIRVGFDIPWTQDRDGPGNGVFWLPAYHDMGLIGGILMPIYTGGHSILMSPTTFLQRPIKWLRAISEYKAAVSGGPNFGYELCLRKIEDSQCHDLDLSTWKLAFCGAEPIRAETLEQFAQKFARYGFRPDAFYPCYGLAEATLIASGGLGPCRPTVIHVDKNLLGQNKIRTCNQADRQRTISLVGCGTALLDEEVLIVDPETRHALPAGHVGEIWLRGPNIARGYWNREQLSREMFQATLAGSNEGPFLRTGDLGFIYNGQLFVTGRIKEVIIVRGSNHYPQDIELTVQKAHPALLPSSGVAFAVGDNGDEKLIVVHEVDRRYRKADFDEIIRAIRRNVAEEHNLELSGVVLIRQATLPRTTSGKIQRNLCRQRYLEGQLKVVAQWHKADAAPPAADGPSGEQTAQRLAGKPEQGNGRVVFDGKLRPYLPQSKPASRQQAERLAAKIEELLLEWLAARTGLSPGEVTPDRPFAEYGLDSLAAVELSEQLEDALDVKLTPVVAWNYPTPRTLARYLAELACGLLEAEQPACQSPSDEQDRLERLIAEIEALSDEEAEAALKSQQTDL